MAPQADIDVSCAALSAPLRRLLAALRGLLVLPIGLLLLASSRCGNLAHT